MKDNIQEWLTLNQEAQELEAKATQARKARDAKMGEIFKIQAAAKKECYQYVLHHNGKNYFVIANNMGNTITYSEVEVL